MTPRLWSRLVVALSDFDVPRMLGSWAWLIDRPLVPIELTRFGDWFLTDDRGRVHRLDLLDGTLGPICDAVAEYERRKTCLPERDDWFAEAMFDALVQSGQCPGPREGFGHRGPPIIGGPLTRDNICIVEIESWQIFMSALHQAVRRLPPGAKIIRLEPLEDGTIRIVTAGN